MKTDIQLYPNESLESFLLRLSQEQGYERFSHFAEDIWFDTIDQHEAIAGAFPLELNRVNIYHAQTTSQMRVRVLIHLESQLKLNDFGVLRLALSHSKAQFSPQYKAVHRFGADYPYAFVRKRFTPICPLCIDEAPYIRQQWQFISQQACEHHGCKLVHHCPECKSRLEYQSTESISQCECGYELRKSPVEDAPEAEVLVAQWLSGKDSKHLGSLKGEMTISERYGFLLWYVNRYSDIDALSFESFIECCSAWPTALWQDLDVLKEKAELVRVKDWKKVFFNEAFGVLLKDCRQLPSRQLSNNIVLTQVLAYFTQLMATVPSSAKGNIGDVLLSPLEASTLLSCTTDEVYRLYEFGEIKASIRPRMHTKIASHESAFTLRSVIETKLTRMSSESDGLNVYLPEW
ncbi:TniQ family protein [Vibrio coralliilyticus]|uniref:TniQ family protein n=1 Tax=Vibrio coralliilyticus TaxID=190893 RepID=UPI001560ED73|nr:TniQ family protein [Vibrio coralliilyticus]NRF51536.1 TniQ family protein [Vibrio coralliilyticus]NRG06040.1 TniQ family protein [Vibrio coralliilyticus]